MILAGLVVLLLLNIFLCNPLYLKLPPIAMPRNWNYFCSTVNTESTKLSPKMYYTYINCKSFLVILLFLFTRNWKKKAVRNWYTVSRLENQQTCLVILPNRKNENIDVIPAGTCQNVKTMSIYRRFDVVLSCAVWGCHH